MLYSNGDVPVAVNAQDEMHFGQKNLDVNFEKFYGIKPSQIDRRFVIKLSDMSYLPKVSNPRADWVVTAATNAFTAFQAAQYSQVRRFATVGTGSGTDVIAALEVFPELSGIAMTDLHTDVVEHAKKNVLAATEKADDRVRELATGLVGRAGDVLNPLQGEKPFDLIYENLPNVPLQFNGSLLDGQASATYVGDRSADEIPSFVSEALLDLHYVCLVQARAYGLLSHGGAVLSSMGGRVPFSIMLQLADAAGFNGRVLSLDWKAQSEPASVIGGYAEEEQKGRGPFRFYPTSALSSVLDERTPAGAALCAAQIDSELASSQLTAVEALQKHREGIEIGHTVVVMASVVKE